jgi:hypothetical protein
VADAGETERHRSPQAAQPTGYDGNAVFHRFRYRDRHHRPQEVVMRKSGWIVALVFMAATPALAQTPAPSSFPDLRGTWKGESESIVSHGGNPHHGTPPQSEPTLNSVPFTLTIDKQDGRRFSGNFSSPHATEQVIGVISRNRTILLVDTDGYAMGTLLAPNRLELCYLQIAPHGRVASCTEMNKQP